MGRKFFSSRILGGGGGSAIAALLLVSLSFPLTSLARQVVTPSVDYQHMALEKVISIYREAYADSGVTRMHRHIERTKIFPDGSQEIREEIRFSKPSFRGAPEYASFYLEAFTRDGICHDCAITRKDYLFENYEDDWRATRRITQVLGQALAPVCDNMACPSSVKDWVNGKSDKAPVPGISQGQPVQQPTAAGHH